MANCYDEDDDDDDDDNERHRHKHHWLVNGKNFLKEITKIREERLRKEMLQS